MQLAHAGRKASRSSPWKGRKCLSPAEGGWQIVAPSDISYYPEGMTPHALTQTEIKELILAFGKAAEGALVAGFEVIKLHAAHGYLINQFLSSLSNVRTDAYGGSFENRIRFLTEIVQEVRERIGDKIPLFVRISAIDWVEGGWSLDDSVALAKILKDLSVDVMDNSSVGNSKLQKVTVAARCTRFPLQKKSKKNPEFLRAQSDTLQQPLKPEKYCRTAKPI